MTRAKFERLVAEAIALIPTRFRREMKNLALVVEGEPSPELLEEMEIDPPDTLFGLYQGIPLTARGTWYGASPILPDRITLYQNNIERVCRTPAELKEKVLEVLIHEIGHYFGMTDEEIRLAGY